ncbi:hypothetical protein SDC9_139111 [bioreactor metagenome]|uniref:Uncharacterized protein n=1 Tax=bioreactor metagenome TaxID=1076179 RepID=A0A645DRM1_9ZZZZ
MVGVAENDLRTQLFKFARGHGLDRAAGADRHENRRFHIAVGGVQNSGPGPAFRAPDLDFKYHTSP